MSYRIRFHPEVTDNPDAITRWLIDYAGPQSAARRLDEIEATIASLADLPHKGSCRDEIAPGAARYSSRPQGRGRLHRRR